MAKNKNLAFVGIVIIGILILQEIAFRIIFPIPEVENFNRIEYSPLFFKADRSGTEERYLSNASFIWASDPDGVEYKINLNLYGFRDENWSIEKPDDKERAIFVGDSFVEGFMATKDSCPPQVFERLAYEDYYDMEAINLGIGGSKFNSYFKVVRDGVTLFNPDYIFLVINSNDFPINEFDRDLLDKPIEPAFSNPLTPRAIKVLNFYLNDRTVPHIWHSEPFVFFPEVPSLRNPWSLRKNAEKWEKFVEPKVADAMKKGRFNPFSVINYDKYKKNLRDSIDVAGHLSALRNFADLKGVELLVVYFPSRSQVSDYYLKYQKTFTKTKNPTSLMGEEYQLHARMINRACNILGISFYDLTGDFRKAESDGVRLYWDYDEHPNGKGYALAGTALYDWFKEME